MSVYVQPGDQIVIPIRSGDETLMWDTTVADDCGGQGYWYCDTCQESLAHNLEAATHDQQKHRLAWICFEHGPETISPK
jgi:hypothetical protein